MILCIDDEPKGLQVRRLLLEHLGYSVLTAASGREGLALFTAHPVAAVVLDYRMPEMDGGQVAVELRRLKPHVKILLLSAYLDLPPEVLKLVDERVVKGTSPTAFVTVLQQLLCSCQNAVHA
jgi:two-component system alkaline phosphatase synthesis response regulator PhoP